VSERIAYLDSSALVKLAVAEPETRRLYAFLADWPERVASALVHVEVPRALARAGAPPGTRRRALAVLGRIVVVAIDDAVLSRAARVEPAALRSLDAIHLATAFRLGEDLGVFVTYDDRLAAAAKQAGLQVEAPH
jgi:predicted nucleic acid-binding protein